MRYDEFRRAKFRRLALFSLAGALAFLFSFYLGISTSSDKIDFSIVSSLFCDSKQNMILTQIRLPRTLGASLAGALLGLSGCAMQGILRNPLASPYTLGISQAAAFGASFAIIFFGVLQSGAEFGATSVVICAFGASMLCAALILYLGKKTRMSPSSLILSGVALGALFNASTMMLQFFASDLNAAAALFWTFGDLSKANGANSTALSLCLGFCLAILWLNHWKIDALSLGDDAARSRGVSVLNIRILVILIATLCAALAVSYFGIIGFVGLVAPHLVKFTIGGAHAVLIPFSALYGAILLNFADVASKLIIPQIILPIGIVTAFAGVPLFLFLIARQKNV